MKVSFRKRILMSFCLATIVLCVAAMSVYTSFNQMNRQKAWVDHTYEVLTSLQEILSCLKDVQSSQRGFVITGTEDYLSPYVMALPRITEQMSNLGRLVADNPTQVGSFKQLEGHVQERVILADKIIAAYRKDGQETAFEMIRKGSGKAEMDAIRTIVGNMTAEENKLLQTRRDALQASSRLTIYTGFAGVLACLFILITVFVLIHREAQQRAKTEEILKQAYADMEAINQETQRISKMGDYLRSCRIEDEAYVMIKKNMPILFPGTHGAVYIFNNSRNLLQSVLEWGDHPSASELDPESCWALRQGRIHESSVKGLDPVCDHIHDLADGAAICFPMQAHGKTFGQFFIAAADARVLQAHESQTIRSVGEQVSLALANLSLQKALREQSIKDPLTKLFNRRYLEETLSRECSRAMRNGQPLAILMMDIDHFKKVNDGYGHDAGDAVLVAFAKLLHGKVRKEDIACRLGGEEFVLVMPAADLTNAKIRADEINEATRQMTVKINQQILSVTVSIGVSMFPEHTQNESDLLHYADLALYKAKNTGRNRAIVFDQSLMQKAI